MKLQTQIPLPPAANQFGYEDTVTLIGSCFTENIGTQLINYKFQAITNPYGILFHPLAIEQLLFDAVNSKTYSQSDVFYHNEQWHCYNAHSQLSNASQETLVTKLNEGLQSTKKALKNSTHLFITLGTAWVYSLKSEKRVVANCHKVPSSQFEKTILSVKEIEASLTRIIHLAQKLNPNLDLVFTLSPIRHLKDGFIENARSKAHLLSAIHRVNEMEGTSYFPSFEIMMDQLRDYRFYASDMIHPSTQALDYLWECFVATYLRQSSQEAFTLISEIKRGLAHRPFNATSDAHRQFLAELQLKMEKVQGMHPHILF